MLDDLSDAEEAVRPARRYVPLPLFVNEADFSARRIMATGYDDGKKVPLERRAASATGRAKGTTSRGKAVPNAGQRKGATSQPKKGNGFV